MKRFILFVPLILFLVLGAFLYKGLFLNPKAMPSALEGKPVPAFKLLTVTKGDRVVTQADLLGDYYLLNVWATWCPSCKAEHPYLLDIARSGIPIYGINYKDDLSAAAKWLSDYQDPYRFSVFDVEGNLGLNLGVYGAPETFLVDHKGIIRLRYAGVIDNNSWGKKFVPLINTIKSEMTRDSSS
ncbi:MAG: DsbE family thiol:disulfide interchange protein [Gammaproteobacteria bacterium]|nr:DsbE family thiol:disulfide interchange protein [Gammaproteobacteria bacterium]